jgi:mannose-1-phosphate guanylyltransferase / mannose-6-phosphate isomerase
LSTRIFPVIMSGGSGTRLWPLSTEVRPKQFHALMGAHSLFEETALRLAGTRGNLEFLPPIIVAGESHGELIADSCRAIGVTPSAIVLEPIGRNTAATAALAALTAQAIDPDALVLLMPADHIVSDVAAFAAAVELAADTARTHIVTFGIRPDGPETGYGYIQQGEALANGVHRVAAFKEKPARPEAERMLREGGYTWNSGVFFFNPAVMLDEFAIASADIRDDARRALNSARRDGVSIHLDRDIFGAVRAEPVDIAVMEKTRRAAVVPCSIGWADVGSWAELWRLSEKDAAGNVVLGRGAVHDGTNNLLHGTNGVHVAVAGLSDLVVVATAEAVLIMPRARAQDVKTFIPPKD